MQDGGGGYRSFASTQTPTKQSNAATRTQMAAATSHLPTGSLAARDFIFANEAFNLFLRSETLPKYAVNSRWRSQSHPKYQTSASSYTHFTVNCGGTEHERTSPRRLAFRP